MRYAVGDIHGYRLELHDAMHAAGLIDGSGTWSGGTHEVWFAGDLLDRGPDGVGVIADVMRWQAEAAEAGGSVRSVLGNHEVLGLGVRRFADAIIPGAERGEIPHSFALSWMVNGGQPRDQEAMTDEMAAWLADLPAMVLLGGDLLMHADTTEYLAWGTTPGQISAAITDVLHGDDVLAWWEVWRAMTTRYDFLGVGGADRAADLLALLGGSRIVHGHSLVADLRDIDPTTVEHPWSYADGRVLAVDGGIYAGGPCLVVPLENG